MNRDQEIVQRSHSFREQYRKETPSWYRGEMHLAFTLLFTGGVIWYCAASINQASWAEWLWVVLPMFLFGNWAEWAAHRYLLHSPKSLLKSAYKRHVNTHHQFFSHKTLDYHGHRDWRALLFPRSPRCCSCWRRFRLHCCWARYGLPTPATSRC